MRGGFRLGKLFGIQIRADWSWLLIFSLTSWNLANVLSANHPNWSAGLSWGIAVIAALLFFLSVLAHELAHSLVARARGIPVKNITLHLFGGVSNIQREPESASTELLMAIVGPVTSLLLGGALLIIFGLTTRLPQTTFTQPEQVLQNLGTVTTLLLWLGSVNIFVGFFNLIPGFPLDGGRILRAIFWGLTDNLRRATQWASWIGRAIAWLMISTGIAMTFGIQVPLLGGGLADGLWLAFIGWFLHSAAVQSYRQLIVRDALEDVAVRDLMRQQPLTVPPTCSVSALVHNHVMQNDDYAFLVMVDDRLIGLVTLDDVRAVSREAWNETTVQDIMTPTAQLITISPGDNAREALDRLAQRDVRQLPVLLDGKLEGLLRRRDIIKWLQLEAKLA